MARGRRRAIEPTTKGEPTDKSNYCRDVISVWKTVRLCKKQDSEYTTVAKSGPYCRIPRLAAFFGVL
ncbi:hypothetical protein SERLA73DRAFT_122798 [Serpula lacrymans var. lacrymans S7.3]|uniref:Uncharacterized protein n=2 Tax=Serpula lacrymans var. lacrymans TaxID=341189 RepID=F8PYH9_SERL3|nr:uncharacterized protein SERLADRAFT_369784 [Serpula lacrymans var. lacrymans S7.9]EGN98942.1 hypothetical protein SERLA73DRAFT_122798 [Serpula lacrymans var. lacrymans S7.3]EGO24532.1 hypothetical protein SERLADRAFT_369784 [Serpula lacrymans var. lacrymans S7.9]